MRRIIIQSCLLYGLFLFVLLADCFAQGRPSLFFREDWKEIPPAIPVTQDHVANNELILGLYGPGRDSIKKSNHDYPVDDPYYIWSGLCERNWAVSLKNKKQNVDLTGNAKIIWRTKQSGFRNLRLILKLADGRWLVSDQFDDQSKDWRIREFNIMDINWHELHLEKIHEGRLVSNPDLTNVEEIGFTDLMRGGKSSACSRLDWIEVYGNAVSREK